MLSKKEADAYRQIQAELKGYRRIRKYELLFMMATSALFILLVPLTLLVMLANIMAIPLTRDKTIILLLGMSVIIIGLYWRIWERGHISWKELLEWFYEMIRNLKGFMRLGE